jgi:hypothetical protein
VAGSVRVFPLYCSSKLPQYLRVKKSISVSAVFSLTLILISPTNASAKNSSSEGKAPCRLEVDYAHISHGKLKIEGINYVKVKARSICTLPQRQVTIELKIMKLGEFYDHEVRAFRTNPLLSSSSGYRVEMNNALIRCKNSKLTFYFGIATSRALVNGQWVYAKETHSISPKPLRCGT